MAGVTHRSARGREPETAVLGGTADATGGPGVSSGAATVTRPAPPARTDVNGGQRVGDAAIPGIDADTDSGAKHPSPPPNLIEDYALLSDLRTAALVGRDGSIDWLCLPRFDSPSCFSRILGDENNGHWRIAPTGPIRETRRAYRDHSLVLETAFHTDEGVVQLVDSMPPHPKNTTDEPAVVRVLECLSGCVEIRMRWVIRFAYGDSTPWVRRIPPTDDGGPEHILAVAGPHAVSLRGDPLPVRVPHERAHEVVFTISEGERFCWLMQWMRSDQAEPAVLDPIQETADSEDFWRGWSDQITYTGPHADMVIRSLVTLKALTYAPTGGIVAAPTTSLPETHQGERNWDYRYCWLRDATFTLLALDNFGCINEAAAWRDWLLRAVAGDPSDLQIMYGIEGERHLIEWELDWLPGHRGARPVRVGNLAYKQLQLDVYGEVMDALHLARERGLRDSDEGWALQRGMLSHLERIWQSPDRGLWEVRGPDRYFTHSRIMVWVAFDRAVRAVRDHGLSGPVERWSRLRDTVWDEVMERGWNPEVGAFTQYYGGRDLDAATLLIPAVGFLPGDDPRVCSTIEAIDRELRDGDLLARYSTHRGRSAVDGLFGQEGAFLACSFWFVDALATAGRVKEAEEMFDRLCGLSNDVGLFAEEYHADPVTAADAGRFAGNFPQAFSHLALVNSAAQLFGGHMRYERDRAGSGEPGAVNR